MMTDTERKTLVSQSQYFRGEITFKEFEKAMSDYQEETLVSKEIYRPCAYCQEYFPYRSLTPVRKNIPGLYLKYSYKTNPYYICKVCKVILAV